MITNYTAELLNPVFLENCRKNPELGPSLLFFSGGSALKEISRTLKLYSHNSIHMVTPFDSGGSSAALRHAFSMPSVGDLRSRLISLADENITGHPEVYRLFNHRLPANGHHDELVNNLNSMVDGSNPMVKSIPDPMRHLICSQLRHFQSSMPENFDLRGASIGNLILAGGYLHNNRELEQTTFLFTKLVGAKGIVRTTVSENLHLMAELEDGSQIFGQHRLTGKEFAQIGSPIRNITLSNDAKQLIPTRPEISKKNRKYIDHADLICFPPGSLYSSIIANLLPKGVCQAISRNPAPKVFVPCLGHDPEQFGLSTERSIEVLLHYLKLGTNQDCPSSQLLNHVLMDSSNGNYASAVSKSRMDKLGIKLIDTTLITEQSTPYYDPDLLVGTLLSLV
ncbi:MAG: GAK system CofD-like protein [Gammaproteobacteria bacterium]|nr:GAK system CofD-like protein [Gammaproteobacteria bacterium]